MEVKEAHKLCYSYIYGENNLQVNYEKAYKWCSISASHNTSSSQTLLAELYLNGNGVEKDLIKAAEFYEKAALQDHVHAQLMVFLVHNDYREEQSTQEEKAKGIIFLKKSKEAKYPKAIAVYNKVYGAEI